MNSLTPPQAMPDTYKDKDAIFAYHKYYLGEKNTSLRGKHEALQNSRHLQNVEDVFFSANLFSFFDVSQSSHEIQNGIECDTSIVCHIQIIFRFPKVGQEGFDVCLGLTPNVVVHV